MLRSRSPLSSGGFCPWRWSLVIRRSSSERTVLRLVSAPSLLSNEHSGPGPGAAVEDFSSCENGVAAWARSRTRRDLQTASRLGKSGSAARASRGWSFPAASGSSARRRSAAVRGCARSSSSPVRVWRGSGSPASRSVGSWRSSFRGASASSGRTPSWAVELRALRFEAGSRIRSLRHGAFFGTRLRAEACSTRPG